jgi:hypothetical protein
MPVPTLVAPASAPAPEEIMRFRTRNTVFKRTFRCESSSYSTINYSISYCRPVGLNNMESAHLMFLAQIATMVASAASAVLIATLAILEKRVSLSPVVASVAHSLFSATIGNTGEKVKYITLCFLLKLPPWLPVLPPPFLLLLLQYWRKG